MGSLGTALFGRDRRTSLQWTTVAGALFLVVFVVYRAPWPAVSAPVTTTPRIGFLTLAGTYLAVVCVLVAVQASHNDGALVSWLIAFAGTYPFYLSVTLSPWGSPSLLGRIVVPLGYALVVALPAATIGFCIGAGARRLRTARRRE